MFLFAEYQDLISSLAVALGSGLLIGAERERRKARNTERPPSAGLRTFAIVSLMGAVSFWVGGALLAGVAMVVVSALMGISYLQNAKEDPGLTTEVALMLTLLLGAAAIKVPEIAASLAVVLTVLLAARDPMHRFIKSVMTSSEANDALILAGATLIILPLMPDIGPGGYEVVNPQHIWMVVVLVLSISAVGHIASRAMGAQRGLPLAGFFSGFVSSTLTIATMGGRVKMHPELHRPAVAAAVLSTIASLIQLSVIMGVVSPALLKQMAGPIIWSIVTATIYGFAFTILSQERRAGKDDIVRHNHAFSLKTALYFAFMITVILIASDTLNDWFGERGVMLATAIAGLADTHAATASVASLVSAGKLAPGLAVLPLMLAMTVNMFTRIGLTLVPRNRAFALGVIPGLILTNLAAWGGYVFGLPWVTL